MDTVDTWVTSKQVVGCSDTKLKWAMLGRLSKVVHNKESVVSFLQQPDVNYCDPGRKDTAFCGKSDGNKIYHLKHYLLYT